jgi:tetratricopeptide (TPR) repeat protein
MELMRSGENTQCPGGTADRLAALPIDGQNSAPRTRAWLQYQDDCAAMVLLGHLGGEGLDGVVIERSTDLVLIPADGDPELVSIKHREANRSGTAGWSWTAMAKDRVLHHLYEQWIAHGKRCSVAFWSNTGFADKTLGLWQVCANGDQASTALVRQLARHLGISEPRAAEFLSVLHLPQKPLPRRDEIKDVAIRRTADLLRPLRDDADRTAEACFRRLRDLVREAGTDTPERATERAARAATLREAASLRDVQRIRSEYLSRTSVLDLLLGVHDQLTAGRADRGIRWQPDPLFTGRRDELARLAELLQPGSPHEVPPVLIYGMTGSGKTSLATQFAATHADAFQPIFITGTSRASVERGLAMVRGAAGPAHPDDLSDASGPATHRLPGSSATLLIIDGVTDTKAVAGLIPRRSLCRVVVTSTVRHIDQGYEPIHLGTWSRVDTLAFVAAAFPSSPAAARRRLAVALGDHPLAVTQAVNYCLGADRSIDEFLHRLGNQPEVALQRGIAASHPSGLVGAINMHIRSVQQQHSAAYDLLVLLAYLSGEPFDERLFSRRHGLVFAAPLQKRRVEEPFLDRLRRPIRGDRQGRFAVDAEMTVRAREADRALSDEATREQAVDLLIGRSLATRRSDGLVVHPLIAAVVKHLEPDPSPWIELGLGLLAQPLELPNAEEVNAALDRDIDHIAALVVAALDSDLHGPGVLAAGTVLCRHLATRSDVPPFDTVERAIEFASRVHDLVTAQVREGWLPAGALVMQKRSLAGLLQRAGRIDDAIGHLCEIAELADDSFGVGTDDSHHVRLQTLIDLGAIAENSRRRDLAEYVLVKLEPFDHGEPTLDPNGRAAVAGIQALLLRLLNRSDEAVAVNTAAVERLSGEEVNEDLRADLYRAGVMLARDRGDGALAFEHAQALLELRRRVVGKRVSWHLAAALRDCADAAIGAHDHQQAVELLTETEEVARTNFGTDSREYARYLASLGRLNLQRQHWNDAWEDLTTAVEKLRRGAEADRTEVAVALVHLGQVQMYLDCPEEAARSFEEAIAIDTAVYGPQHPETLRDIEIRDAAAGDVALQRRVYALTRLMAEGGPVNSNGPIAAVPDLVPFPGPTYEAMTGRIQAGVGPFGCITTWRLHRPGVGICHGLLTGPPGSGRTTALTVILISAMHSQRFVVMPAAPSWQPDERSMWRKASPYASEGRAEVARLFQRLDRVLTTRQDAGGYQDPAPERPAILVTLDDSEALLSDRQIRTIAERIVTNGGQAGIGLVAVTSGETVEHFGDSEIIQKALMAAPRMSFTGRPDSRCKPTPE